MHEGAGISKNVRIERAKLSIDSNGVLSEDFSIGECSPSFASYIVSYQSCNGWTSWVDENGKSLDDYRKQAKQESMEK